MVQGISAALGNSQLSLHIQETRWVVPMVQSIHILAIAFLVFAAFSTGLATARGRAARAVPGGAAALDGVWVALAFLLVSGAILIVGEPGRTLMNLFFRVKMVLLLAAVALTFVLQRRLRRGDAALSRPPARLLLGALPVLLWLGVIFCGRLIAYFGAITAPAA